MEYACTLTDTNKLWTKYRFGWQSFCCCLCFSMLNPSRHVTELDHLHVSSYVICILLLSAHVINRWTASVHCNNQTCQCNGKHVKKNNIESKHNTTAIDDVIKHDTQWKISIKNAVKELFFSLQLHSATLCNSWMLDSMTSQIKKQMFWTKSLLSTWPYDKPALNDQASRTAEQTGRSTLQCKMKHSCVCYKMYCEMFSSMLTATSSCQLMGY